MKRVWLINAIDKHICVEKWTKTFTCIWHCYQSINKLFQICIFIEYFHFDKNISCASLLLVNILSKRSDLFKQVNFDHVYVILECLEFLKTFEIRNIGKYVKFNDRSFMNISMKAYGAFCTRDHFNFIWNFINWKIWDFIEFLKWWKEYSQFINLWPKLDIDRIFL